MTHNSRCRCGRCRRQWRKRCNGTGIDARCSIKTPHAHCVCMLPMDAKAKMCEMCIAEGLVATDYDEVDWDGVSYPSFRRHRTRAPHPLLYVTLFEVANGLVPAYQTSIK